MSIVLHRKKPVPYFGYADAVVGDVIKLVGAYDSNIEGRDWAKEAGLKMGDEATVREIQGPYVLIQGSRWWQLKQRFNLVRANKKR